MPILSPADFTAVPWKNGRGTTLELARHPAEGAFAWRLSIADVVEEAPFSPFPGYDRTILVLEGAGIRLGFEDGETIELTRESAPFSFSGDRALVGGPLAGPTRDFNLMVDPARFTAWIEILGVGERFAPMRGEAFVYADGDVALADGRAIPAGHLLRGEAPEELTIASGRAIAIALEAHP